jgi:hypothetical protein
LGEGARCLRRDAPQFPTLVKETANGFHVGEVSADKAYSSLENFEAVADCGGEAFIAFKSNASGRRGGLFERMLRYFQFRQEEFLQHYHKRSNAESTFSAIKRKFGDFVRAKGDVAMHNEVLCKVIAHNLCCLIQEQCELGITPVFWGEPEVKPEPLAIELAPVTCEEPDFAEFAFL